MVRGFASLYLQLGGTSPGILFCQNIDKMPAIEPLDSSALDRLPLETPGERFWGKVPLLGWAISNSLWTQRHRPLHDAYDAQIEQRSDTREHWNGDALYREVAAVICEAAHREMPWPNAHFIPDDPFRVVYWSYYDGLDLESAMMYIEENLGIDVKEDRISTYIEGTLGDFVEDLCALVRSGAHT